MTLRVTRKGMTAGHTAAYDRTGLALAMGSHLVWGSMPLYLILVKAVPAVEFVAWRLIFTLPLCIAVVVWRRGAAELRAVLADRKALATLAGSAAMIAINWLLYVWAIQTDHVYAASLGYYILPLVMMVLGVVFLRERLSILQRAAVGIAALGVAALAAGALTTLWLSISMGLTFGFYGLLRKTVAAGSITGLTIETIILMPVALAVAGWFAAGPQGTAMAVSWPQALAIALSGLMTGVPLMMFAEAARRLPYTVVGFIQFASPTIVFLLGLFYFGEELHMAQLAAFIAIWIAAGLFTWDLLRARRPVSARA